MNKKAEKMSSDAVKEHDSLIERLEKTKKQWDEEKQANGGQEKEDETDQILNKAIEMAIAEGKGWGPGEKEAYMKRIGDEDYIPPLFASSMEELERTGLKDAFSSLVYDDEKPGRLMLDFKKKGNDSFVLGKKNLAKNFQYYRDAINHYYEAIAWADQVSPIDAIDEKNENDKEVREKKEEKEQDEDDPVFTQIELDHMKSTLYGNASMAHLQLKNWGHTRDNAEKAISFNENNVKACYRLAVAHQHLSDWEGAGNAIDSGLAIEGESQNKDLLKLRKLLGKKIEKARLARRIRERERALRVSKVKTVWKYCKENNIRLGRVPLVSSVTDEEDADELLDENENSGESQWHQHYPHTGKLPAISSDKGSSTSWTWPCMFLYPSHNQSDFIANFGEDEMLALRMADIFPELNDNETETKMPWDYNNEFVCSNLAVYFEVHSTSYDKNEDGENIIHPESVELLKDQGSCMRFYEASRALKGDDGQDIAHLARLVERKRLHRQRKAWKTKHGSLWHNPDAPCAVLRVHPACVLRDILQDKRMVVPNFLVTFLLFPEDHPAHMDFIQKRKCLGLIEPKKQQT